MILNAMQCATCKQMAIPSPQAPILVRSKDELIAAATQIHGNTGIICGDMKLVVPYTPALMDSRMFAIADQNAVDLADRHRNGGG